MRKLRISHGSGGKAVRLYRQKWCRGMVMGLPCGSRSMNDPTVRIFCNAGCAARFKRLLAQTEPSAMTAKV